MRSNFKKIVIFILGFIVVIGILFKPSYQPDSDFSDAFDINSKKAFGFYGFKSLLEQMKGKNAINHPSDSVALNDLKGMNGVSAIILGKSVVIKDNQLNDLDTFLKDGNTLVVLSENLYFYDEQNEGVAIVEEDTLSSNINSTSSDNSEFDNTVQDTIPHIVKNDSVLFYLKKQLNSITTLKCSKAYLVDSDIILDSTISNNIYHGFSESFIKNGFVSNINCDGTFVSLSFSAYTGKVVFYFAPKLFSNYYINQKWYPKNASFIFDKLAEGEIYFLNNFGYKSNERERYLLAEILKKPSLRYAYYLTMIMILLSIIFSFSRKYNPTEMIVKKKNLSMQYAKSLSILFFIDSDYYNMIIKIKNNFYHFVHKNYYLLPTDPDFVKNLAKRTGSPENLIESIIKLCEVNRDQKPNEQHFNELYQKTEKFKKISSPWK